MKTFIKYALAPILLAGMMCPALAADATGASVLTGAELEKYVIQVLKEKGVTPANIRALILANPDDMQAVVDGARSAGATDSQLLEECYLELPKETVPDFVRAGITAQIPAAELLEACLNAVPVEESFDVVFAAMQAADPLELSALIRVAIAHYGTEEFDGNQILVSSLIAGDFLNPDLIPANCSTACMEEIAQSTLEFLTELQEPLAPSAVVTDVVEPPLSDS